MFGIAEIEHPSIRERQRTGIEMAKAKVVNTGRKKGTLKAKPERAWEMSDQGMNKSEIARPFVFRPNIRIKA